MTSYLNACDVTLANSNYEIFHSFLTSTCEPPLEKGSSAPGCFRDKQHYQR